MFILNTDKRVVVTGIGVYVNNGKNKNEFWENCANGVSGIKPCTVFDASNLRTNYVGEIDEKLPYLTDIPGEEGRIHKIMDKAINEMFVDSCLKREDIQQLEDRAYLSFATSLASINNITGYVCDKADGKITGEWLTRIPSFVDWIKDKVGVNGGCYTTMTACASGSAAAGLAMDLIQSDRADLVIVGGADPLIEFTCVGFHVLRSLSCSECRPFDKNRDGINIGEGGAFLVMEELSHAQKRGAKIYAEILGYGINNDAYHITSPNPNGCGAIASMSKAISQAGISIDQIDYINAHGTGTKVNDKMEAAVFYKMFGKVPFISSTKSMTAHCLAAAGVIELVISIMSLVNNKIPPTIRLEEKIEECKDGAYNTTTVDKEVQYVMSNSYAFAGNTSSVLIGAYNDEQ